MTAEQIAASMGNAPAATDGARPNNPATVVMAPPPAPSDTDDEGGSDQTPDTPDLAAEVEKWKALARKHEKAANEGKTAAKRLAEVEQGQQTDLERQLAQIRTETTKEVSGKYTQKLARLSITAAARDFQDPDDAVAHLSGQLADFVDDEGDVDETAIKRAVADLLKKRPYLGKGKPPPDMDSGQRNGAPSQTDMNKQIREQVFGR
jgi:hypothetical protein